MPSRKGRAPTVLSVETLREAARERIAASSVRAVADAIGMSHPGLLEFLKGRKPQAKTLHKLTEWYLLLAEAGELDIPPEIASTAAHVLLQHFPPDRRERAVRELIAFVSELTAREKTPPPDWLAVLSQGV